MENLDKECVICFEPSECSLRCRHNVCGICIRKIDKCPLCRGIINNKIRVYVKTLTGIGIYFHMAQLVILNSG